MKRPSARWHSAPPGPANRPGRCSRCWRWHSTACAPGHPGPAGPGARSGAGIPSQEAAPRAQPLQPPHRPGKPGCCRPAVMESGARSQHAARPQRALARPRSWGAAAGSIAGAPPRWPRPPAPRAWTGRPPPRRRPPPPHTNRRCHRHLRHCHCRPSRLATRPPAYSSMCPGPGPGGPHGAGACAVLLLLRPLSRPWGLGNGAQG